MTNELVSIKEVTLYRAWLVLGSSAGG